MLYIGLGDGGSAGRSARQRPEPRRRCSARSCASIRRRRRRAVHRSRPTTRSSGAPARRPRSGCTACATRGASRSTARPATCGSATSARTSTRRSTTRRARPTTGSQLGLEPPRGHARRSTGAAADRRPRPDLRDSARRRQVRGHRRLRVPRHRDSRAPRRVRVRRLLPLGELDGARRNATARSPTSATSAAPTCELTSFGEDATGELYVLVARSATIFRIDPALSSPPAASDASARLATTGRRATDANGATLERLPSTLFIAPGTITAWFLARPSRPARATRLGFLPQEARHLFGSNVGARLELGAREAGHKHADRQRRCPSAPRARPR